MDECDKFRKLVFLALEYGKTKLGHVSTADANMALDQAIFLLEEALEHAKNLVDNSRSPVTELENSGEVL